MRYLIFLFLITLISCNSGSKKLEETTVEKPVKITTQYTSMDKQNINNLSDCDESLSLAKSIKTFNKRSKMGDYDAERTLLDRMNQGPMDLIYGQENYESNFDLFIDRAGNVIAARFISSSKNLTEKQITESTNIYLKYKFAPLRDSEKCYTMQKHSVKATPKG